MSKMIVKICYGRKCIKNGAKYIVQRIFDELTEDIKKFDELEVGQELQLKKINIIKQECTDNCGEFPLVEVDGVVIKHATSISVWNYINKKNEQ